MEKMYSTILFFKKSVDSIYSLNVIVRLEISLYAYIRRDCNKARGYYHIVIRIQSINVCVKKVCLFMKIHATKNVRTNRSRITRR